jgi:hypothetical protein
LSALDAAALCYVIAPSLIFLAGWARPGPALVLVGLVLIVMAAIAAAVVSRRRSRVSPVAGRAASALEWPVVVFAFGTAALWSGLGGAGHLFFANAFDWVVRDAVLRDLVVQPWPVTYTGLEGEPLLLRAPIAYYLPAALLGHGFGLVRADLFLYGWTFLGTGLFFCQIARLQSAWRARVLALLVFILFSGWDMLGSWLDGTGFSLFDTHHLEQWARSFQFSSSTTQLFWVPNHALAGWLLVGVIIRKRSPEACWAAIATWPFTFLWSPLTALGLVPFLGAACWEQRHSIRRGWRAWAPSALAASICLAVSMGYLLLDSQSVPRGWYFATLDDVGYDFRQLFFFLALEIGVWAAALRWAGAGRAALLPLGVLCLLPLYRLGPANDWVMRASIPALAWLAIVAAQALIDCVHERRWRGVAALGVTLAVGAITPAHELARALLTPRWAPDLQMNTLQATQGKAAHYFARLSQAAAPGWMKDAAP